MSETPIYAGCPWPLDLTCIDEDAWNAFSADVRSLATALASESLRTLTAYRYGGCPITVRPSKLEDCCIPAYENYRPWMVPGLNSRGLWINSCGCRRSCSHGPMCSVRLPAPVGRIDSIKVDGMEQTLSNFRIDNGNLVVYTAGGDCPFYASQDLRLNDTEVGTWSITYLNAFEPDRLAAQAAARLAFEFAVACADDQSGRRKCKLPSNVVSIVRTGVTMELDAAAWPGNLTGIREIDAWLSSVNPKGRRSQSRVYSPDVCEPYIQGKALAQTVWDGGSPGGSGGTDIDGGAP